MKTLLWGTLAVVEMVVAMPLAYPALRNALMIARTRSSVFTPNRAYFFGMLLGDFLRIVPACLLVWHATVITRTLVVSHSVRTDPPPSRDVRAINVIGILLAAPVVGFLLGAFAFGLTLPRHRAPGDGIGVMLSGS